MILLKISVIIIYLIRDLITRNLVMLVLTLVKPKIQNAAVVFGTHKREHAYLHPSLIPELTEDILHGGRG